jgi:mycofactocin precursor peptide peptidase
MTSGGSVQLGTVAWPDVTDHVLFVPVGSTEQHGHHLPMSTDTLIAEAIAKRAAALIPGAMVSPSITMSASGEHEGFPGTISIGTDALAIVLIEVARSASRWASRLVFVNGHGGNADACRRAEQEWTREGRNAHVWVPPLPAGGDWHAGWVETSVMLALHPDLVRVSRADGVIEQSSAVTGDLRRSGVRAVSPSGVLGQPSLATPERGEEVISTWVAALVDRLQRAT